MAQRSQNWNDMMSSWNPENSDRITHNEFPNEYQGVDYLLFLTSGVTVIGRVDYSQQSKSNILRWVDTGTGNIVTNQVMAWQQYEKILLFSGIEVKKFFDFEFRYVTFVLLTYDYTLDNVYALGELAQRLFHTKELKDFRVNKLEQGTYKNHLVITLMPGRSFVPIDNYHIIEGVLTEL